MIQNATVTSLKLSVTLCSPYNTTCVSLPIPDLPKIPSYFFGSLNALAVLSLKAFLHGLPKLMAPGT